MYDQLKSLFFMPSPTVSESVEIFKSIELVCIEFVFKVNNIDFENVHEMLEVLKFFFNFINQQKIEKKYFSFLNHVGQKTKNRINTILSRNF